MQGTANFPTNVSTKYMYADTDFEENYFPIETPI